MIYTYGVPYYWGRQIHIWACWKHNLPIGLWLTSQVHLIHFKVLTIVNWYKIKLMV